jgi:hypothetical protein
MSSNPWSTASEKIAQFVSLDKGLARDLGELSQHQAHDAALEFALEAGRSFGMRQAQYNVLQQRHLNAEVRIPFTAKSW